MAAVLAGRATSSRRIDWLLYLPVIVALCGIWALLAIYTVAERRNALERVQTQLGTVVATLADFSELADSTDSSVNDERSASRGAAIWRALLQYPSASIWVESGGVVTAGVVVQDAPGARLIATDSR